MEKKKMEKKNKMDQRREIFTNIRKFLDEVDAAKNKRDKIKVSTTLFQYLLENESFWKKIVNYDLPIQKLIESIDKKSTEFLNTNFDYLRTRSETKLVHELKNVCLQVQDMIKRINSS